MALPLWIEFFDELQNVRGRSQNTVKAYRRDLETFEAFKEKNKNITKIYDYLNKQGLKQRSQARVISSIRTYLRFCERNGLECPELRELRLPKVVNALPKVLSKTDFQKLISACVVDDENKTKRNQITLLLLYGMGCRVSELINLDLTDFNETESWLKVTGKGEKERLVPLTELLRKELKNYIKNHRLSLTKTSSYSVLINDRGKRPSRVDIWRWLSAWSAKAGFEKAVSPHQFRHGCATALLESGADLRSIQMLLGHSSLQTTQIYTSVSSTKARKTIEEHHPLSKIKL